MNDAVADPRLPMTRLLASLFFPLALPCLALADQPKKSPTPTTTPKAKTPDAPLGEARQLWLRGNYEEARAGYEKLLDDEKTRAAAAIGVARTWLSEGNHAKALAALDEAIKKDEKSADLLAARAEVYYQTGRTEEAAKDADAAIKLKPDHFQARWIRAEMIRDTGDITKADVEMRWFARPYPQRENADKPIKDPDELLIVGLAGAENARWHSLVDQFRFLVNDLYPDVAKYD